MQFYSKYWRCKHLHLILPLVNTGYWTAMFCTYIRHTSTPKKSPQITSPTAREALYYSNLHSEICWTAKWWNCDTTHSCTPRTGATNTFGKIGIMKGVHSIWCYLNHFWLFCAPEPKFKDQFLQDKVEHAKPINPPKTSNILKSCKMSTFFAPVMVVGHLPMKLQTLITFANGIQKNMVWCVKNPCQLLKRISYLFYLTRVSILNI